MPKKTYHVVQRKGGWGVRGEGNQRDSSRHRTQQDAWKAAKGYSENNSSGGEVITHGRNGQIRERSTYNRDDPYPPEG